MTCLHNENTWTKYVNNQLSASEIELLEDHLLHCDSCLQHYENVLAAELNSESQVLDIPDLTFQIMSSLELEQKLPEIKRQQVKKTRHMFIHYAIAASIAFILFQLGMFDQFMAITDQTQQVTEQTSQFFDSLNSQPIEWFQKLKFLERSQS